MGLIVFILVLLAFSFNINSFPLRNWDEAWYAEIIKNMANGSGLLVPFWNGQYYFDKSPLYFWLSLPFFEIFGTGEWQARIVSVLAGTTAVFLIFLIGKKLFNASVGLFSSIIFVTLGQVYFRFSHGNLDALIIVLFLATFYSFLFSHKKIMASLCGIFLGLGFLVKGWSLGLFPLFVIIIYSLIVQKRLPSNLFFVIVFALLSSGWWYVLGAKEFGQPFVHWYLLTFAEGTLNSSLSSFSLEIFKFFIRDLGVWLLLIPLYLIKVGHKELTKVKELVAFGVIPSSFLFLLSFALEKSDWHNLPVYPFVALFLGFVAAKLNEICGKKFLFLFVFFIALQTFIVYKIENIYPDRSRVGAQLGQYAVKVIPKDATIILDDRDFTSFLYYSGHKTVFVVWPEPIEEREWWFIRKQELAFFVQTHPNSWLVSPNQDILVSRPGKCQVKDRYTEYFFIYCSL